MSISCSWLSQFNWIDQAIVHFCDNFCFAYYWLGRRVAVAWQLEIILYLDLKKLFCFLPAVKGLYAVASYSFTKLMAIWRCVCHYGKKFRIKLAAEMKCGLIADRIKSDDGFCFSHLSSFSHCYILQQLVVNILIYRVSTTALWIAIQILDFAALEMFLGANGFTKCIMFSLQKFKI